LATAVVAALLLFVGVPSASAKDYRGNCRQKIEKAEFKLDQAIRQHGFSSRQAQKRRSQLRAERERCWNRDHSWWDSRSQSWRNDQDWDRDDSHDRDHH
jgi:hypothetical protein